MASFIDGTEDAGVFLARMEWGFLGFQEGKENWEGVCRVGWKMRMGDKDSESLGKLESLSNYAISCLRFRYEC